ncbi:protein of unknown function [Pararobbsia alpina]
MRECHTPRRSPQRRAGSGVPMPRCLRLDNAAENRILRAIPIFPTYKSWIQVKNFDSGGMLKSADFSQLGADACPGESALEQAENPRNVASVMHFAA